jgi:uncharacterized protein (TIGR00106 family)
MLAELRITPVQVKSDFVSEVAAVVRVLAGTKLRYQVHAMGTSLEGDLPEILEAVRRCHEEVRQISSRTLIELSIDDRDAPDGELVRSLQHLRRAPLAAALERLTASA